MCTASLVLAEWAMQAVGGGGGGRLEFAAAVAPLAHVGGAALALGLAKRARDAACAAHAQDERGDGDGAPQNCALPGFDSAGDGAKGSA